MLRLLLHACHNRTAPRPAAGRRGACASTVSSSTSDTFASSSPSLALSIAYAADGDSLSRISRAKRTQLMPNLSSSVRVNDDAGEKPYFPLLWLRRKRIPMLHCTATRAACATQPFLSASSGARQWTELRQAHRASQPARPGRRCGAHWRLPAGQRASRLWFRSRGRRFSPSSGPAGIILGRWLGALD